MTDLMHFSIYMTFQSYEFLFAPDNKNTPIFAIL